MKGLVSIILFIFVIGFCGYVLYRLFKDLWNDCSLNKNRPKQTSENKISKQIVSYENKAGDKRYEVVLNGKKTGIKWVYLDDAEFYYNHIDGMPKAKYMYNYSTRASSCKYFFVPMDKCNIYLIPIEEMGNEYHYTSLTSNGEAFKKYVFKMTNNPYTRRSLRNMYENIVNTDYYEEKVILSTDKIKQELEDAVDTNDIEKLKKIVDEYRETVEMQQAMTNMLIKICESDKKYREKKNDNKT